MASEETIEKITEEEINGMEPGELPPVNESVGDKVVNVLEDILGEDAGQDDLQKELDDTASKKEGIQKTKKTPKATTRRKSGRKKAPLKGKSESGSNSPTKVDGKVSLEAVVNSKVKPTKGEVTDKKVEKVSEASNGSKVDIKVDKTGKVKVTPATNEVSEKNETPPKSTKASKKIKKEGAEKDKKESKKSEELKAVDEKEALVKKVKELEKMVVSKPTTPLSSLEGDTSKGKKHKSSLKNSSERKRKGSESLSKETKSKRVKESKGKEEKSKAEIVEKLEEEDLLSGIGIKEEPLSDTEDMRVIDDVDELSDHGSHISNASSFSHTFSRSPSFTGSFTGTFSGSLSLSSFTASNTSLAGDVGADELDDHKNFIDSLLKGARYFIVKSNNYENVTLSKAKGVWATPPANERKLNDAYRHSTNVILIFSVKESGRFQGFARLASESRHDGVPVPWVLPPGFDRRILGGTFKVDWLNRKEVLFSQCANLRNPWNENKEVKICRDGQELEPSVGEVLCRMFEEDYLIDLSNVSRHLKHRKRLGEYFPKHDHQPRFRGGGQRSNWRGGHRGDFGGFRGDRGRFGGRRGGFFRRDSSGGEFRNISSFAGRHNRFGEDRGRGTRPFNNRYDRPDRMDRFPPHRSRSRTPTDYRHDDRESRDRRHKDKVKEFLKNDRTKFGVRKETLLHGSYTDYVREFQRQKQMRSSSYYAPNSNYHHHVSGSRSSQFDAKAAAEEFLRRSSRR